MSFLHRRGICRLAAGWKASPALYVAMVALGMAIAVLWRDLRGFLVAASILFVAASALLGRLSPGGFGLVLMMQGGLLATAGRAVGLKTDQVLGGMVRYGLISSAAGVAVLAARVPRPAFDGSLPSVWRSERDARPPSGGGVAQHRRLGKH